MEIRIKPVSSDEEFRDAVALFTQVHRVESHNLREWLSRDSERYPNFRREHTRLLFVGNELACALRLTTDTILLGESRLRMGGLGWVSTVEKHRGKGLSTRLIRDTLEYMRINNYHVSMLFGIPNFYQRFGYVTTLADYVVELDTVEALTFSNELGLKLATPSEIPILMKLHGVVNTNIACTILRTSAHFTNRWDLWRKWYCLTDKNGRVIAYFLAKKEGNALHVDDVGLSDFGYCAGVVGAVARLAMEDGASIILFYLPPCHFLARYLLQFRSNHIMRLERNAGGMMAFVNILECFEHLIPEWENLLAKSFFKDFRGEVCFCVGDESYRIRCNRGVIDVSANEGRNKIRLMPSDLMHLVTGYRYVDDIITNQSYSLSLDTREFLSTIFPKRIPYVWRFDRF